MLKPINLFFIIAIVASRFLPHPPNFTPILAIFMLSGGPSLVPLLLTYMITDAVIGFHSYMIWVYSSLFLISYLKQGPIISSLLFFLLTNFAVWLSGFYGLNLSGLITTYIMAIPFFVNTLLSTLIFYHLGRYYLQSKNIDTHFALQR